MAHPLLRQMKMMGTCREVPLSHQALACVVTVWLPPCQGCPHTSMPCLPNKQGCIMQQQSTTNGVIATN